MKHLMIDLETLGKRPNAQIISIGAVEFDIATGKMGREFYRQIDLASACQYGVPDGDTIKWWLTQGEAARKAASEGKTALDVALKELHAFLPNWSDIQVWVNSPSFDCVILEYAYHKIGMSHPWAFWNTRDCRTIAEIAGQRPPKMTGVAHNALEDAKHQAQWVSAFWRKIKGLDRAKAVDELDI